MGICNLDENKELAADIAAYIEISIQESLNSGQVFKLFPIFKTMYDALYESDKDQIRAAGVAAVVPQLFFNVLEKDPSLMVKLVQKNSANIKSIDAIKTLQKEIEASPDPIDLVISKLDKKGLTIRQINQNNLTKNPEEEKVFLKYVEDYGIVKDKVLKSQGYDKTTGQSQQQVGNRVTTVTRSDADKATSYAALQNILARHNPKLNFENDTIDGHSGFRLAAVIEANIPDPQKNIYNIDKTSTRLVQAIVDNDGNYLYFDEKGNITTKEEGKIAYFPFKSTNPKDVEKNIKMSIDLFNQSLEELEASPEEKTELKNKFEKEITEQIEKEAAQVDEWKAKVEAGETLLFNITGGTTGAIDNPDSIEFSGIRDLIQKPLSEYDLDKDETKLSTTKYVSNKTSYTTPAIRFKNHTELISLKGVKISEGDPRLLGDLVNLLIENLVRPNGDVVTPQEKVSLFYEYTKPFGLNFSFDEGNLVIHYGKQQERLDLSDPQIATQKLEEFLNNNAWFTYVKRDLPVYTAFSIKDGVLTTSQQPYNPFIFQYLIPRVAYDTRTRRPMINNGYFTFEPTNLKAVVKQKAEETVKESEEILKQNNYSDTKGLADLLDRSKLIEARSDKAQKEKADKWIATAAILKETYKGVRLFTEVDARDVTNSDSFASFANATLTLYKGFD